MAFREWLKPPKHVLVLFVGITLALAATLGWVGWRLLQQDRTLETQQVRDRLENAADAVVAAMEKRKAETEAALNRLATFPLSDLHARAAEFGRDLPDGALVLVLAAGAIDARPSDPKRLPPNERLRLAGRIRERALGVSLGAASVREIDRLNIYHATVLAMRRALNRLPLTPDHVIVDGKRISTLAVTHTAVVGGDHRCYSIACASIVAKVTRDRLMGALAKRYPNYHWEHNVGYTTKAHLLGLAECGVTPHHRRSFIPVAQLTLALDGGAEVDITELTRWMDDAVEDADVAEHFD